jgi:hypothetical protein
MWLSYDVLQSPVPKSNVEISMLDIRYSVLDLRVSTFDLRYPNTTAHPETYQLPIHAYVAE